jgi:hypothetical protein
MLVFRGHASKKVMQFIAFIAHKQAGVDLDALLCFLYFWRFRSAPHVCR